MLSLEPEWTISINEKDFISARSADIEVDQTMITFGRLRRKILNVEWLRSNTPRVFTRSRLRTQPDILTFYPGRRLPSGIDLRRRRRLFQAQLANALGEISGP